MKKRFIIPLVVMAVVVAAIAVAWMNLPRIITYAIGHAVHGEARAADIRVGLSGQALSVDVSGLTLEGDVEGRIERCRIELVVGAPVTVRYLAISEFSIAVKKERGGFKFVPVPVEKAEIKNGTAVFRGKTFRINEITVMNFNTRSPMEFSIDASADGFGRLRMKGGGDFFETRSDIRGDFRLTNLKLESFLKNYLGDSDCEGKFRYADGRFSMEGGFEVRDGSLWEFFLRKRIASPPASGIIRLAQKDAQIDVRLEGLAWKGIPLVFDFSTDGKDMLRMEFSSGFLSVHDVQEYIDLEAFGGRRAEYFTTVKNGSVEVKKLIAGTRYAFRAETDLRDVETQYKGVTIDGISGLMSFNEHEMVFSGMSARYKNSSFSSITGVIPFAEDRYVNLKGDYSLDLADLRERLEFGIVAVRSGRATGSARVSAREAGGMELAAAGTLTGAQFVARGLSMEASGRYRASGEEIIFDPLILEKEKTRISLQGRVGKVIELEVGGDVEGTLVASLIGLPYRTEGVANLQGQVESRGGVFSASGRVGLGDLSVEVPGIFKKEAGLAADASFSITGEQEKLSVKQFSLDLAGIDLDARGELSRQGISDLRLVVDAPSLSKAAGLFYLDDGQAGGSLRADVALADLPFTLTRLPEMNGQISLKNASFRPPALVNPVREINLVLDLKGQRHSLDIDRLHIGRTVLRGAKILIEGRDALSVSATVAMAALDPSDFARKEERAWHIPVIGISSILARTRGTLILDADTFFLDSMTGKDLRVRGSFAERMLEVPEARVDMLEGRAQLRGRLDLTGPVPRLGLQGDLDDIRAGGFLRLFDPESEIVKGRAGGSAEIMCEGTTPDELLRTMDGKVTVYSRDGVIKKWNLISKIFGLLNVYDLLRGKLRLTSEGLPYSKMGATFTVSKGIFHTENLLLDSPSMVMTGKVDLDMPARTVDGKIAVSPLVAIDRTIDKIPLIRSIFREKDQGFLYVEYDVKGPLSDPQLSSSYATSIPSRALGILRNILQLPMGVLQK